MPLAMLLPNLDRATIDPRKLVDYALNPNHPEGRHKARVFLSALGITAADGDWLANSILSSLSRSEAILQETVRWGRIFRVDMEITRGTRCAKIRTGWLCTSKEAKLLTCFVVGECNETT